MNKGILNALILVGAVSTANISSAETFTCPTLNPNEIYYYFGWINSAGDKFAQGEWNKHLWRLWINGDSYFTPKNLPVTTTPLAAHYFASTNTWYLKCTSGDLSVGPRNNVWPYDTCNITASGFECTKTRTQISPSPSPNLNSAIP